MAYGVGCLGKEAIKWVSVCVSLHVCGIIFYFVFKLSVCPTYC